MIRAVWDILSLATVKVLWVKERVKEVAMAIKTEPGEIKVLGCTETGQELWSEALRRKKRRTGEFLPKANGQILTIKIR